MPYSNITESTKALLRKIETYGVNKNFSPQQVIYNVGGQPSGFYYIESGLVGLSKLSVNGKQSLLRVYSQHRFFGYRSLLGNDRYYASTVALKPCQVLFFPFKTIEALQEKVPDIFQYVTIFLASELKDAELRLSQISFMKMKHRVIDSLLYLKNNHDDYSWTYREIGEFCGGETETVIRICNQLKKQGAIERHDRQLKIVSKQKLLQLRDECC